MLATSTFVIISKQTNCD